jgi:hypothetical protein
LSVQSGKSDRKGNDKNDGGMIGAVKGDDRVECGVEVVMTRVITLSMQNAK